MNYYLIENNKQLGPFDYSVLISKEIDSSTLVWKQGFKNWEQAGKIKDLSIVLKTVQQNKIKRKVNLPPPIPDQSLLRKSKKYDLSYKKETEATVFGVILLLATISIPLIIKYNGIINYENEKFVNAIMQWSRLIVHTLITIWVVSIAKRQNRNQFGWGVFTFILAPFSLMIIGQLNKLLDKTNIDTKTLTEEQKKQIIIRKSKEAKLRN